MGAKYRQNVAVKPGASNKSSANAVMADRDEQSVLCVRLIVQRY